MQEVTRRIFLPGAGANPEYWSLVAIKLSHQTENVFLSWPGLGDEPPSPSVQGIDDLVAMVVAEMTEPCDLVAQSLGGLIAVRATVARPDMVRRLVLVATSGGVPVRTLGGCDWRDDYYRTYPRAARWIGNVTEDLSDELRTIHTPTLLIWGDNDPISPVGIGRHLQQLLPNAQLQIVSGGNHDLARTHPQLVADMIEAHLLEHVTFPNRTPFQPPKREFMTGSDLVLREATAADEDTLWRFLAIASYEPNAEATKRVPVVAAHLRAWPRQGDFGVLATRNQVPVGAAWARQFGPDEGATYYAGPDVPEVSIAVLPEERGKGVGGLLLHHLAVLAANRRVAGLCLNVRDTNPARRLYERAGYRLVDGAAIPNRVGGLSLGMRLLIGPSHRVLGP